MRFKPIFILVLLFGHFCSLAQNFLPPVTSYNSSDYSAASQNWGLSTDKDGTLYVANNEGLLRFDGQRWEVFTLPNKTIIRSVFCLGDRIYTGSYEEFGYWTNDEFGSLEYTSLSPLIKSKYVGVQEKKPQNNYSVHCTSWPNERCDYSCTTLFNLFLL